MASTSKQVQLPQAQASGQPRHPTGAAVLVLVGGTIALLLALCLSISVGAASIRLPVVWSALFHFNPDLTEHQIVREMRMPRALASALVGASFAVSGAVMQGMTRNPLADSGLLGLNAGASLMLAVCFAFFPGTGYINLLLLCFLGAGVGAGIVYGIGSLSRSGLTPVRLTLSGAAVGALLTALSEGIALFFRIGQDMAFWFAGGVAGTTWLQLKIMFPWMGAALLGAVVLSRSITVLSLGADVAAGLGLRTGYVKVASLLVVLVLAGGSVAAVGAVGFVGLIIPHLTRYMVGVDYRRIIPCSAVLGSLLVVLADVAARTIEPPYEKPIGALIALMGVPFFLYLARRERRELR